MRKIPDFLLLLLLGGMTFKSVAQTSLPNRQYALTTNKVDFIQHKNYYLLNLLQQLPDVSELLKNDPAIKTFTSHKIQLVEESLNSCTAIPCFSTNMQFSEEEIKQISDRLSSLYTPENALGKLVSNHLIPSGCYSLFAPLSPKEMLIKAWEQDAKAINHTIAVYVNGDKPNYPRIDSISFNTNSKGYTELVAINARLALTTPNTLFFEPSLKFALEALEINERKDAADYEPMISTVNKKAVETIKKINWSKYPYSVILVPGEGPEDHDTELSAGGMLRCRLAALQYTKGAAPFIVVSGGRVHPYKTKYSEANEMKKFLIGTLGIPAEAIIMEPHARHTTTNMRNCVRLMFRYGIPLDKPAITSTLPSQSSYISDVLLDRCQKELGYFPYKNGKRLSATEMEFYPVITSLQIDFDEPLDP